MTAKQRHDMGSGGKCICPKCEASVSHERGLPCQELRCLSCGVKMLRVGSPHYDLWKTKQDAKKGSGYC